MRDVGGKVQESQAGVGGGWGGYLTDNLPMADSQCLSFVIINMA